MTSNIDTINEHEDSTDAYVETFNDNDRIDTVNDNDRRWKKQMKENKLKDALETYVDNNHDRRVDAQQMMLDRYDLDGDGKLNTSEQQNIGHDILRMEDIAKMQKKMIIAACCFILLLAITNIGSGYCAMMLAKDLKVASDGVMKNMNGGNVKTEGIAPKVTLYEVSEGGRRLKKSKRTIHRKLQDGQGADGSNTAIEGYLDEQGVNDVLRSGLVEFRTDNGMQSCEVTGFENKSATDYTLYTTCGTGTLELQEEESQQEGEGIRRRMLDSDKKTMVLSINKDSNNDDQQRLQFSIFGDHACALFSKEVHCVGRNRNGQLGRPQMELQFKISTKMSGLENKTPLQVVTGSSHTCVLVNDETYNGSVYCVGANKYGQLGDVTPENSSTELVQVVNKDDNNTPLTNIKQIAAGGHNNCAILEDDSIYCWGLNTFNRLGFNNEAVTDVKFMALSADRTCIVTASNTNQVQCTNRDTSSSEPIVTIDFGDDVITKLTAGSNHLCALLEAGTAKCFGRNSYGQFGNGELDSDWTGRWNPVPQSVLADANDSEVLSGITDINAGSGCTCLIADGEPMCFGYNGIYQVGIDNTDSNNVLNDKVLYPTRVPLTFPDNKELVSVHVGYYTCHAVFSDNTVYSWGTNQYGTFGDGSENYRKIYRAQFEDETISGNVRAVRMRFNSDDWY